MAAHADVIPATAGHSQRALTARCLLTISHLQMDTFSDDTLGSQMSLTSIGSADAVSAKVL